MTELLLRFDIFGLGLTFSDKMYSNENGSDTLQIIGTFRFKYGIASKTLQIIGSLSLK